MGLLMKMPSMARAFVLSTGLALNPFLSYAQDAMPEQEPAPSTFPHDIDYPDVESLLLSADLAEDDVAAAMAVMYQNIFRVSRKYIRSVEMEELERSIYEGVQMRLDNRAEKLEEAQNGVQEATQALSILKEEQVALQLQGADIPVELSDKIIEADLDIREARLALRHAEIYQSVDAEALINAGLDYAFKGLDPHTSFNVGGNPLAGVQLEDETPVNEAGIGVIILPDGESKYLLDRGVIIKSVLAPEDKTPAFIANIKPGELITHVDNEPLAGLLIKDAHAMITGSIGSSANLTVENDLGVSRNIRVQRAVIEQKNVTHRVVDGNIGYMHINAFMNNQVAEDIEAAILKIQQEVGSADLVAGYVISVRDNGGGLLSEVVELNNLFIDGEDFDHGYGVEVSEEVMRRNSVVTTRNREGMDERYLTNQGDIIEGKPLIVLTNGGSASASEIFAGTIQEYRGKTVGITTFGKGTVQEMGSGPRGIGKLKYTISEYTYGPGTEETPMGLSVQHHGIAPNIYTPDEPLFDIAESRLENSILSDGRRSAYSEPEMTCERTSEIEIDLNEIDASFIDPRKNEFDIILKCAVMVIKNETLSGPQVNIELRPYSPSDIPAPSPE